MLAMEMGFTLERCESCFYQEYVKIYCQHISIIYQTNGFHNLLSFSNFI